MTLRRNRPPEIVVEPDETVSLRHVSKLRHELAAPSSLETRDVARALRAAGYEVTIGSPQTLTEPWTLTASEIVDGDSLPSDVLHEAVLRVRVLTEEQGGSHMRSVVDEGTG